MKPASQRSRHLAPGDKLGKFELIRQIAIGGMAELYLARTLGIEGFEKLVVVKRILPQHASNAAFVDMFLNEARLAATLHHPNVAQVYDIGVEAGEYFFAMEYVHGEDLDQISHQANEQGVPLSMDASLTLVAGLCAGLHYAHDKLGPDGRPLEIVHRDVSPSNVIVSYDGAVKLVDFGIARATKQQTTTHGGLKGKIAYMSPEQCRSSGRIDRRCDIFSVGMLLYELTTGQLPFTGETEYQLLDQIVNRDAPPPSSLVPGYPPALERIVLRALSRDRDRRYSTALELQGALEDFAHESRLRVSPLVLARLMSSLFPARLEEWAHAKAQGAFFVEQHVVRTLIEDGKTPPPDDPALRAAHDAIRAHEAIVAEDESTSLDGMPPMDDTDVGSPPITAPLPTVAQAAKTRTPTPNPTRASTPNVTTPTPDPTRGSTPNVTRGSAPNMARRPTPDPTRGSAPNMARRPTPDPTRSPPAVARVPTAVPQRPLPGMVPIIGAPGTLVSSSLSTPTHGNVPQLSGPSPHAAPTLMLQANPHAPTPLTPMPLPPAPTPPMPLPPAPTPSVPVAVAQVGDVTERVYVPRGEVTLHIRVPKQRSPLIWIAGLVVVAGSIAAVIAFKGSSSKAAPAAASRAPAVEPPPVEAAKPEPPPPIAPSAAAEPAKPEAPSPSPPPVEAAKPEEPPPAEAAKPEPAPPPVETPKKIVKVATKPRPVKRTVEKKKPEPKETPSWNADSPFMPVRTDKH